MSRQRRFKKGLTDEQRALLDELGFQWSGRNNSSISAAETNPNLPSIENATERISQESQAVAAAAGTGSIAQLKSPPQDTLKETAVGASEEESQIAKEAGTTINANKYKEEDPSQEDPDDDVSKPAADVAAGDSSTLLLQVTDGSETGTPQLDIDKLASEKAEDRGGKISVRGVRHLGQTRTEHQESDNEDYHQHHPLGKFVPQSVYLQEKTTKRKYKEYAIRYKTKAGRYYEERNKLRREVKRLRGELHRVKSGAQLLAASGEGVAV